MRDRGLSFRGSYSASFHQITLLLVVACRWVLATAAVPALMALVLLLSSRSSASNAQDSQHAMLTITIEMQKNSYSHLLTPILQDGWK